MLKRESSQKNSSRFVLFIIGEGWLGVRKAKIKVFSSLTLDDGFDSNRILEEQKFTLPHRCLYYAGKQSWG